MAIQTYAPGEVHVSFKGKTVTGFGDEIVSVKRNEMLFTTVVGADGEVTRVKNSNKTGEVKITVKQTSAANALLGAIVEKDEITGDQVGALMIKDNNGHTMWSGEGWLAGWPEAVDRGKDAKDQIWTIHCSAISFTFAERPTAA